MIVSSQDLPGSLVEIAVEETPEFVGAMLEKAYRRLVKRVDVPGWRRGKAPRHILERHVGQRALCEEAEREAVPELYEKAREDLGLDVVGEPEFRDISLKPGEPLRFKAIVPVRPKAQPGDYDSLAIPFPEITVSSDEVEEGEEKAKESLAHLDILPSDQPLQEGDYARVHVKGLKGGDAYVEVDSDFDLVKVGTEEHPLFPGLQPALIGMKKGESREFSGTFKVKAGESRKSSESEAHPGAVGDRGEVSDSEVKAVEVRFEVQVLEAYSRHIPTDEEFLKQTGKSSMDEVRENIESLLRSQKFQRAWREHTARVEDALLERGTVDVPSVMVENRTRALLDDFLRDIEKMGDKPEDYLRRTGLTWETIVSDLRDVAQRRLKIELILDAIAQKEGIEPDEEQVRAVVSGVARDTGRDEETVKTTLEVRGVMDAVKKELTRSETLKKLALEAARRAGTPVPESFVQILSHPGVAGEQRVKRETTGNDKEE